MSPIITFALVDRIAHQPLKVTAGGSTVAVANFDPRHGTHTFTLPLDRLLKKDAKGVPFARDLAQSMIRMPNSLYYIAGIETQASQREAELSEKLAAAQKEIERLTFELGNQLPKTVVEAVQDPRKLTRRQRLALGFRGLRKLCIEYQVPDYGAKGSTVETLESKLMKRLADLDRENAATANEGGN